MLIFDNNSYSVCDELKSSLNRVPAENLSSFSSWEGRKVCFIKMWVHAVSIFLKPLYYLAMSLLAPCVLGYNTPEQLEHHRNGSIPWERVVEMNQSFQDNPELVQRMHSTFGALKYVALVAPLSQFIQTAKAVLGIIHPGFYFEEDPLAASIRELANIAEQAGCSEELIRSLQRGSGPIYAKLCSEGGLVYYYALFIDEFNQIAQRCRDPNFSAERKRALLNELAPLPEGSGIEGCPPALGRTLELMINSMNVPEFQATIPWLIDQFKCEIINRMVHQTQHAMLVQQRDHQNMLPWQDVIRRLATDAAHRGNVVIAVLGEVIGLPQKMVNQAKRDLFLRNRQINPADIELLKSAFDGVCTRQAVQDYLQEQINSKPDGSQGLKQFRQHIIQFLSQDVTDEELERSKDQVGQYFKNSNWGDDPAHYVEFHYFLHHNAEHPNINYSHESSTDLNIEGIKRYCRSINLNLG